MVRSLLGFSLAENQLEDRPAEETRGTTYARTSTAASVEIPRDPGALHSRSEG